MLERKNRTHALSPQLPYSKEAEEAVLGSLLIDPEAMALVADVLSPDDFYREAYRLLYQTMRTLWEQRVPPDFITLCDALEQKQLLDQVGGASSIAGLVNTVPTSSHVDYYGRIVAHKSRLRRLIQAAGEIASMAYHEDEDALEQAERLIFAISQQRHRLTSRPVSEVVAACWRDLDALHEQRATLLGMPTGFSALDLLLGGLQRTDLVILAGRPGMGKTSLALSIAHYAALQARQRIAIFTLEMSAKHLVLRLLSMGSGIEQQRLRLGWVQDGEWEQLVAEMGKLSEGAIWLNEQPGLSVLALRSQVRRLQAEYGMDCVIVDYLQLMRATDEQGGRSYSRTREQEIADISRELKGIAKECNVPVLALAQLSRAVENRQSKIPQLSDLRESGAIEAHADIVLLLYRDEVYHPESEARHRADVIIAKHRNGSTGTVHVGFEARTTRFYTLDTDKEKK